MAFPNKSQSRKDQVQVIKNSEIIGGRKMRIFLLRSWVLTDELPLATKGTPVLIDMETRQIHQPGDSIMGISAQQAVSLAVEAMGENYLLPEEMRFISRFKEGIHDNQSIRAGHMGGVKKLTFKEIEFLKRG
jgi:hypothetical protein